MIAASGRSNSAETALRALSLVRDGRLLSITRVISSKTPHGPEIRPPVRFLASGLPLLSSGATVVNDYVTLSTHFGTHIDTRGHIAFNGAFVDGEGAQALSLRGLTDLGAESEGPRLLPARLMNLEREEKWPVDEQRLTRLIDACGGVDSGDALLIRLGNARPPGATFDAAATECLATSGIAMLGSDANIDDAALSLHVRMVAQSDVTLLEGVLLDELATLVGTDPFALFVGPVPVRGASGAWVSAVALL